VALTSVPARRLDPYGAFRFLVEIDGIVGGGFTEVGGLQSELEVLDYREGGRNDHLLRLAGPARFPSNLTLKRGLADSGTLWSWYADAAAGRIARRLVSVVLLDVDRRPAWQWDFVDAYPVRWSGPELRAGDGATAFETLELAHGGLARSASGPTST
jgi:phage tail-like protein